MESYQHKKVKNDFDLDLFEPELFSYSLLYPKNKNIKAVIVPTQSECLKDCFENLTPSTSCYSYCIENQSSFSHILKRLDESHFFNTSSITKSISRNIVYCDL